MTTEVLKRSRGRPRNSTKAEVMERIVNAADRLLERHGPQHCTERQIAAAAGVDQAMIHYYFGGMDGLLSALLDRSASQVLEVYHRLENDTEWHLCNPTRHLVKVLIEAYYAKPWMTRMAVGELTRDTSPMRDFYLKRYGPQGNVHIRNLLDRLVERGIYERGIDTTLVALHLFSSIVSPLLVTRLTDTLGIGLDELRSDRWIDYLSEQFDGQLRKKRPT